MKRIVILSILIIACLWTHAQYVVFRSAEFEAGVKMHLGMSQEDSVLIAQTDTITAIDLSKLGIKDIRDVAWLNHVRKLNLSKNSITDIEPLLLADSLREVNLRDNEIEDIAPLIFSRSDSMLVNVSNNYIDDFYMFFRPTHCTFTLQGMGYQRVKNAPYLSVYNLYSDISDTGTIDIVYRAYTNIGKQIYVECGTNRNDVAPDGTLQRINVPGSPKATTLVRLTNGEQGDSTYVVPPAFYAVDGGKTIEIDTELPENYQIGYVNCLHGTAKSVDNKLEYTAPATSVADTLYFAFYEGNKLRGVSLFYLAKDPTAVLPIDNDAERLLSMNGNVLTVRWRTAELADQATISVYDPSGRMLASKQVDSSNGIDTTITINSSQSPILIVQVVSGRKKWVEKLLYNE